MEQQDAGAEAVTSPPAGGAKSKLDTLSKDDLIKFAKKQMAAMQKLKSKYADMEKEVETLKSKPQSEPNSSSAEDSVIQELTERMDALLLEKAEAHQSLLLMRKESEKAKQQAKDVVQKLATVQAQLDLATEDHQTQTDALRRTIASSAAEHAGEAQRLRQLLEESERGRESERRRAEEDGAETARRGLESRLLALREELEEQAAAAAAQAAAADDQQRAALSAAALTEAQQDAENLREELAQGAARHEQELRALEEDCEAERERLLLLTEELTEQLALRDLSYLQDVQEEEEELGGRSSGIARMLELSGVDGSGSGEVEGTDCGEEARLRATLDDLRAQNTMLQDELTLLGNVKGELEAELNRAREEFQLEREELEFKIDELQMTREGGTTPDPKTRGRDGVDDDAPGPDSDPRTPGTEEEEEEGSEEEVRALRVRCDALSGERDAAVDECRRARDALRGVEAELVEGGTTGILVRDGPKERGPPSPEAEEEAEEESGDGGEREKKPAAASSPERTATAAAELAAENAALRLSLEEATAALSQTRGDGERLGRRLAELEGRLGSEEAELSGLRDREGRARESVRELEEQVEESGRTLQEQERALAGAKEEARGLRDRVEELEKERSLLRSSLEEVEKDKEKEKEELRARVEELEKERSLLRSSLEEVEKERRSEEEAQEELRARVDELEKERTMLRSSLEEVVADTEALQRDLGEMRLANERTRQENQELRSRVTEEERREEEGERGEAEGEVDGEEEEKRRRELEERLAERESVIVRMRSEMTVLQSSANSALSGEKEASQLTEKIALLEKESREKDERTNKIKAVAVKARKELDIARKEVAALKEEVEALKAERERVTSSMKDIIHGAEGYKNLQVDYDRQTEQLDKEREQVDAAERQISELTKRLTTAVTQHEQLCSEREDLLAMVETGRSTARQMEAQVQELNRHGAVLDRDLQAERLLREQKMKDLSSALKEVEELTAQLRRQKQQSLQTAQELEQLRKEAQQSSLLDMEMADYERLVKELNSRLADRDVCVEELKTQIHTLTQTEDTLHQEIEGLKSQLDQGEEKASKMKQLLVKTKKDLADAKKQEASQMLQQASLKGELESYQQQLESAKIQVCDLSAERHRLQEQVRSVLEQQHRTSSSLQMSITNLQEEYSTAKAELASTAAEFESYKVRVHNVLKQQKSKSTSQSDGDSSKLEREQMESAVEQLKARLADSQQSLQTGAAELHQLHAQHDTLLERHNNMLHESVNKEAQLTERLLTLQAEGVSLRTEHAQTVAQLSGQTQAQRAGFREQIRHLQDEHRSAAETLQAQVTRLEKQLFILQSQTSSPQVQSGRKPAGGDRRPAEQQGGVLGLALSELQSMDREEGEGMETTETETPLSSPPRTPLPSLEQLLTSPDPKQEPFVWQVEPSREELGQQLSTARRGMEHMNGLLHETEATNHVLMEQITLLKSEVRRLERNGEREKSAANMEYLKNVLLQFLFLQPGSERRALLPVIHTMLQLSPDEKSRLAAIAHGEEEVGGARRSGWGSYLHSWSGIR